MDEGLTWDLVRALRDACGPDEGEATAGVGGSIEVEIRGTHLIAHPSGAWEASVVEGAERSPALVADAGRALLDIFVPLALQPRLVVGQLGQSLDGRIATESGASHYVTGPEDLDRLHRLRALCDAVIVGASTVDADDPQLTVRRVDGSDPVRVVLDPDARLDVNRRLFKDHAGRTIVVHRAPEAEWADRAAAEELVVPARESSVVESVALGTSSLDLPFLLEALRARGLNRILVEGGGRTVSAFLAAGLLDRLHVTVAPMLIGSGRPSITLEPVVSLSEALRPAYRHFHLGADLLFDLDLRSESS